MSDTIIKRVLRKYGLEWSEILATEKGYRNESHPVILKNGEVINVIIHKSEPGSLSLLTMADAVSGYLNRHGLPTRKMLNDKVIQLSAPSYKQYGAVYNYLPGKTIPWEAYTQNHIKLLGKALSNMHRQLKSLSNARELPYAVNQYFVITEQMKNYFADNGVKCAMANKLGLKIEPVILSRQQKLLKVCHELPEQQALHMDFVRGNILFSEDTGSLEVTGILDFEKTAYGHPVFDIARTLAFLLVDCKYKTDEKIRKYFLISGYNKRGQSSFKEMRLLEELLDLFFLYDFYKFLLHNPYESLAENEHYIRTEHLLLSRNIVDRIGTR